MKTGGSIWTNYGKTKSYDNSTSIKLGIINYLEHEMLALKVDLNNNFHKEAREEDQRGPKSR